MGQQLSSKIKTFIKNFPRPPSGIVGRCDCTWCHAVEYEIAKDWDRDLSNIGQIS